MNRVLVLGGGQLGLMLAEAAARLGLVVDRYDPERALLLPGTSDLAVPITWEECLERYPVVTVEREAVPDSGLSARLAASDPTDELIPSATTKAACGAWPGADNA